MNPWLVVLVLAAVLCAAAIVVRHRIFRRIPVVRPTRPEVGTAHLAALEAFNPLTLGERLKIRLLVRRGKPLRDTHLVPAAVAHARRAILNERLRLSRIQWQQLIAPILLLFSVLASTSFEERGDTVIFQLFWLGLAFTVLSPGRGLLRRYRRSLALNEDRLVAGVTGRTTG